MCVGDVSTQPTGAPYPACASGLSTRSVTPGALRVLSACWRQVASNPARIEFVPMTVMGLPLSPGAGMKPVASPVAWIWVGFSALISNQSAIRAGKNVLQFFLEIRQHEDNSQFRMIHQTDTGGRRLAL